jgi:hypothetical protein
MNTFFGEKPSKSQILQLPHYQGNATSVHGEDDSRPVQLGSQLGIGQIFGDRCPNSAEPLLTPLIPLNPLGLPLAMVY